MSTENDFTDVVDEAVSPNAIESKRDVSSPLLEEEIDRFWEAGEALDRVKIDIAPPDQPLELLEQLGPSPFERGGFPLIGFLATTYDKVTRFALGES